MDFPRARQLFYQEIRQPDEAIALSKAALYIAQEEYPELDIAEYINALDTMAAEVRDRLPQEQYPLRIIKTINQYLYEDLRFVGNVEDYYDLRNSYLNQVIDRRTGIPITLSLVYLEIAQRLDFPMVGVGMPGHFLIRPAVGEMEVFVDPFYKGEILFSADCEERLSQLYGKRIELRPEFVEAIAPKHFLARMLTNLKVIYLNRGEIAKALAAIERILLLFPDAVGERRDRGVVYHHLGRWTEASEDLRYYLDNTPDAEDAAMLRQLLERMSNDN